MEPVSRESLDWAVRAFVYRYLAEHERPPTIVEAANGLQVDPGQVRTAYARLHEQHALFLEPGTVAIRMAHPFSGVPTPFRVRTDDHTYRANCAWDALGIPAMLGARATVDAACSDNREAILLKVEGDGVFGQGELIHFAVPFRRWYNDLIFT
ncbi:MAG TPA: organomercurial lyase [archaeon]|nr:organomercurial lyase [archaeon]